MDKEYFREYYKKNSEKIKNYRKERYKNDEKFRASVKAANKKSQLKKKGAKNAKDEEGNGISTGNVSDGSNN